MAFEYDVSMYDSNVLVFVDETGADKKYFADKRLQCKG